jgi:hypothetical protein
MLKRGVCSIGFALLALIFLAFSMTGCVSTGGTAMETHKKGMTSITEDEYFTTKKPVDRAFIGCAWSKQFGPIEDPAAEDIRVKKERSLSGLQQDYAYNLGVGLGGQLLAGPKAEAGASGGSVEKAKLSGLEIISPVSIADIAFEPKIPYITEALRLNNFAISAEKSNKASLSVGAGIETVGSGTATAEVGSQARRGTEGEGLVVAYKLNWIDLSTYTKKESGNLPLELNKAVDLPQANMFATARLMLIDPGAGKSLPRNVVWSCSKADAKSKDMVAAWVVELKSMDPRRKKLTIAFPAWPVIEDCQNYTGIIYSRIDPITDKIIRQRINIAVINAEVTDNMKPKQWDARISLLDESFNIKMVRPADLELASQ